MSSFTETKEWLDRLPDQMPGEACSICQTGEPYVEFGFSNLARPDDLAAIEDRTCQQFQAAFDKYCNARAGTIYWRIPFEWDVSDAFVVIKYDPEGPDLDFQTNKRCFVDRNWKRVACYARLYRASFKTLKPEESKAQAVAQ